MITGGSSGIGYELAKAFARDRYDLVLVARQREPLLYAAGTLRDQFGVSISAIVKDLSQPSAPEALIAEVRAQGLQVDALVNNAGFTVYGPFAQTPLPVELELMQLNMVAVAHLTKLVLPEMLRRGEGKILNVASTAAFQPGPLMAVYYASKAFVLSFSEALAEELQGSGVTVSALCPGPVPTGFQRRAGVASSRMLQGNLMSAEVVARIGYAGLLRRQRVIIPGLANALVAQLVRLLPRTLVTRGVKFMQQERQPIPPT